MKRSWFVVVALVTIQVFAQYLANGQLPSRSIPRALPSPTPSATPAVQKMKINCVMPNQKPDTSPSTGELNAANLKARAERTDSDCDGIGNLKDNCPYAFNPKQVDRNKNGIGDVCEQKKRIRVRKPNKATFGSNGDLRAISNPQIAPVGKNKTGCMLPGSSNNSSLTSAADDHYGVVMGVQIERPSSVVTDILKRTDSDCD